MDVGDLHVVVDTLGVALFFQVLVIPQVLGNLQVPVITMLLRTLQVWRFHITNSSQVHIILVIATISVLRFSSSETSWSPLTSRALHSYMLTSQTSDFLRALVLYGSSSGPGASDFLAKNFSAMLMLSQDPLATHCSQEMGSLQARDNPQALVIYVPSLLTNSSMSQMIPKVPSAFEVRLKPVTSISMLILGPSHFFLPRPDQTSTIPQGSRSLVSAEQQFASGCRAATVCFWTAVATHLPDEILRAPEICALNS